MSVAAAHPAVDAGGQRLPAASVREAFRDALVDFYFHSGRLVAANAGWGACLTLILGLSLFVAPVALVLLPVAAVPAAGIGRMAGAIVRGGEFVDARQFRAGIRRRGSAALVLAFGVAAVTLVLAVNVALGASQGGVSGWAFATLAGWGLVALWTWLFALWPLLGDPTRDALRSADLARLAATVVLVRPVRMLAGAAAVALVVAVSTALVIVLLGTGIAYASLVAGHTVLPIADRVEGRTGTTA